ncbi:MAG: tRNA (guanosine(46)-N7)-methyltransferase TrmB [Treponema sp.]|nr:tRNA (guanosine(46)-N7)-methyltransferase TrmB [Treponema sp.]
MNEQKKTEKQGDSEPLEPSSQIKREVKTYVLRIGRMTSAQERSYNELSPSWCIPYENKKLNFVDVFGNTNPIIVEIGFGMGDATAEIARQNPDINYLGIEVHKPGVGKLLGQIKKLELKNLYIIEHDALEVLENMIGDNSINGFHIFFPDPWPKKRHHKRRMIQRPRTNLMAQKLAPEGYLYFVTDITDYAEFALEELTLTKGLKNKYEKFAPAQKWRTQTKFEKKGMDADRQITELLFEKK